MPSALSSELFVVVVVVGFAVVVCVVCCFVVVGFSVVWVVGFSFYC